MIRTQHRVQPRAWRVFSRRDGEFINNHLRQRSAPVCPLCMDVLEARGGSRCASSLPLGAQGFDLDCRGCRRFWVVVRHTPRSIRIMRMRRFIAAVRSMDAAPLAAAGEMPPRRNGASVAAPDAEGMGAPMPTAAR